MNLKNILLMSAVAGFFMTACEQKSAEVKEEIIAEADKPVEKAEAANENKATKIEFEEREFDFGKINKGEMVSHTFSFTNTGNAPLVIMDAKASCGCTVPQWTKEPVSPGEKGEIEVKYNGSGSGQVHKTVTVFANTDPKETVLEIKANVRSIDLEMKGPFKEQ